MSWTVIVFVAAALALGGYMLHKRMQAKIAAFEAQQRAAQPEVTGAAGMAPAPVKMDPYETRLVASGKLKGRRIYVRPVFAELQRQRENIFAVNPNATL